VEACIHRRDPSTIYRSYGADAQVVPDTVNFFQKCVFM